MGMKLQEGFQAGRLQLPSKEHYTTRISGLTRKKNRGKKKKETNFFPVSTSAHPNPVAAAPR